MHLHHSAQYRGKQPDMLHVVTAQIEQNLPYFYAKLRGYTASLRWIQMRDFNFFLRVSLIP